MRVPHITVEEVIGDYLDATGHEGELNETYLKKCFSDGSDRISTYHQLTHYVEVFDVKDYKVVAPTNLKYIIQAACRPDPPYPTSREMISKMTQDVLGSGCEIEININCPQCNSEPCTCTDRKVVEVDTNRIWETANPKYYTSYMKHFYMHSGNTGRGTTSVYSNDFILMRTAAGSFWNTPYHLNGCLSTRIESEYEYRVDFPAIITNFREGEMLVGYMGSKVDKEGYLTVPNTPQAIQAVVWYAAERMAFRRYNNQPTQTNRVFWTDMMQMREKHVGRAKNELRQWSEDEFWDWVDNHWRKVIPYRGFRKNLHRNQPDKFMLPDQTLNIDGYVAPYYRKQYGIT